jgi:hypothetical protein
VRKRGVSKTKTLLKTKNLPRRGVGAHEKQKSQASKTWLLCKIAK